MSRAEEVERVCADFVRGREVVGRRLFTTTMYLRGEPAFVLCTRKTRRVVAYARTAFDAATWFVDIDRAGVRLPRRKAFDVGTSDSDLAFESERLVHVRARYAYYEHLLERSRKELAAARARLLGVLAGPRADR